MRHFDELINPVRMDNGISGNISMIQYKHSGKLKIFLLLCFLAVIYVVYLLALENDVVTW